MNVLVIPEDPRRDAAILQPLVEAMLRALPGRFRVAVCHDPILGGVSNALKWDNIHQVIETWRWSTHLFLLVVDRDGEPGRRAQLDRLEAQAEAALTDTGKAFFAVNAWQEVETWVLAGLPDFGGPWSDVRAERDVKEVWFSPFARRRGLADAPYEGRALLAREAARNMDRIRRRCPEDIGALMERLRSWVRLERDGGS